MGFTNYDRTSHKILANGITTIEFNGEHPNYYKVFNLSENVLYCSTNNIPSKKLFDFKVEPNSSMSFAEPYPRDRIYIYNPSNTDCEILLTKYLGEFDPVFNALSNTGIEIQGTIETDGAINSFNAPLPSGTNNIGKVGLDNTTLQSLIDIITQANSGGVDYTTILNNLKSDIENIKNWNYYIGNISDVTDVISDQVYGTEEKLDSIVAILTEIKESGGGGFFFDGYKSGTLPMIQKVNNSGWHYLYQLPGVKYFTELKIYSVSTLKDSDLKTVKVICFREDGSFDSFDLLNMPSLDWIPTNEVYTDMVLYVHRNNAIQLEFKYSYKLCKNNTQEVIEKNTPSWDMTKQIYTNERVIAVAIENLQLYSNTDVYNGEILGELYIGDIVFPVKLTIENGTGFFGIFQEYAPITSFSIDNFVGTGDILYGICEVSE